MMRIFEEDGSINLWNRGYVLNLRPEAMSGMESIAPGLWEAFRHNRSKLHPVIVNLCLKSYDIAGLGARGLCNFLCDGLLYRVTFMETTARVHLASPNPAARCGLDDISPAVAYRLSIGPQAREITRVIPDILEDTPYRPADKPLARLLALARALATLGVRGVCDTRMDGHLLRLRIFDDHAVLIGLSPAGGSARRGAPARYASHQPYR